MSGQPTIKSADPAAGSPHRCRLRVRYCECDPMGVAHHGSYAAWFELARTEMLRDQGVSYARLERDGFLLMVSSMATRFRFPIRYDDVIEVRTRLVHGGRVRLRHAYEIGVVEPSDSTPSGNKRAGDGPVASAEIELACCGVDGRPRALPGLLRGAAVGSGAGTVGR
ncbi:MAG: thioesterase family protein [Planctomycetota bacterium]